MRRPEWFRILSAVGLAAGLFAGIHIAAGRVVAAEPPADDSIVATVDDDPIRLIDVKRQLATALQQRAIAERDMPVALAHALEQVIYRRLIAADFRRNGVKPTPEEEADQEKIFADHLARVGVSRDDYLKVNKLTEDELASFRYWDICWNRYVRDQLTDERLQTHFDAHRRDYDGTELRASHILLRVEGQGDQATTALAAKKAAEIRQAILDKKLTFAEAAAKYSAGPSRAQNGDLGFLPRRGPMLEEFSAATFRLQVGEISPPVLTAFGVHLITVTEEKPGEKKLVDVRNDIMPPVAVELFRETAQKLRPKAKIEYTGVIPHLDPASGSVVPAGRP